MFKKLRSEATESHKKSFRILTSVFAAVFVCSVTVNAFATANDYVTVNVVDGENTVSVSVKSTAPADVIAAAGIELNANDELILDDYNETNGGTIVIDRAKVVRIVDNDLIGYYVGYDETLDDMLAQNEITILDGDVIDTGIEGRASTKFSPLSFFSVLTLPDIVPTTIGSPILSVPF